MRPTNLLLSNLLDYANARAKGNPKIGVRNLPRTNRRQSMARLRLAGHGANCRTEKNPRINTAPGRTGFDVIARDQ